VSERIEAADSKSTGGRRFPNSDEISAWLPTSRHQELLAGFAGLILTLYQTIETRRRSSKTIVLSNEGLPPRITPEYHPFPLSTQRVPVHHKMSPLDYPHQAPAP